MGHMVRPFIHEKPDITDVCDAGGPGNTVLSSFSGAVFLVGGSGITFALTAVREILQHAAERAARHPDGESGTGTVEIVWTVQHAREYCGHSHNLSRYS